jgi:signal transduction histidine kinase
MARRVLINLVENSSKYSPSKGTITVGAQAEDGWMHFWIKDQGSGIPASEKEHIFDKFTRLRGQSKAGGLGIGLAFCRLAVQGHGGRIWVDSEIGQGATFHFTFPIATDEQITGS